MKNKIKETPAERAARLRLAKCMQTKSVESKRTYKRSREKGSLVAAFDFLSNSCTYPPAFAIFAR